MVTPYSKAINLKHASSLACVLTAAHRDVGASDMSQYHSDHSEIRVFCWLVLVAMSGGQSLPCGRVGPAEHPVHSCRRYGLAGHQRRIRPGTNAFQCQVSDTGSRIRSSTCSDGLSVRSGLRTDQAFSVSFYSSPCLRFAYRFARIFGASLDFVAFAAPAALVAGAAYDVVQEAFAFDEFARKDVLFRNL